MTHLAFAITWLGGLGAAVYLVTIGHPWFAIGVLVLTGSVEFSSSSKRDGKKDDDAA